MSFNQTEKSEKGNASHHENMSLLPYKKYAHEDEYDSLP
jgi:hypothetical protein